MRYTEIQQDLFKMPENYALAHCISADYALGAGIAVQFDKRFNMRKRLKSVGSKTFPDCIHIDQVYNLVTKRFCWQKPTYDTLRAALEQMRDMAVADKDKYLAMPQIGCGLDKLNWESVRAIIKQVFSSTDINIVVCFQK